MARGLRIGYSTGGGSPNLLYSALDMNRVPFHVAAGAYGAQLVFQNAAPPTISSSANASTVAELQAACSTPGTRVTLTANIVGGNITGDMTDIEVVVPNGILMNGTVFGTYGPPAVGVHTRVRFTKATGDTIGGQLHAVQFYGQQGRDVIADGLQLSSGTADPGIPFYLAQDDLARVALLRNRMISAVATYGYGCPHLLIAGNSAYHNANAATNLGDWGFRISSTGASIFFQNDVRVPDSTPFGEAYAPLRYHPRNGSALQYGWAAENTFVNLAEGRTFDCHDTLGTESYPNRIDGIWMLDSRFYVANGFTQLHTRNLGGPTVSYFRINRNRVYGSTGPFSDGSAPDGNVDDNEYNASLGTVPAWGAAGDPTGIDWTP